MKKFLSLVLALVMAMSLVTISAGAKDFEDNSDINYADAVAVMSELKVVDGYTDGSFRPEAQLNRGAAAKIICNMILGPTTASALSASSAPFSDVPADHVFAGYIAYCSKEGIINGYADGTFRPTAPLTGYAFMKMLLGALGYDADLEGYTGANWSINVAKQALYLGLEDGNDSFVGTQYVTREEACLYAFNTLQAEMVEYDSKTTVTVNGAEVVVGGSEAKVIEEGYTFADAYFANLKVSETVDAFGRPANIWKIKSKEVGTFAESYELIYTSAVKGGKIWEDLGEVEVNKAYHYEDGKGSKAATDLIAEDEDEKFGGNGTIVEVYAEEVKVGDEYKWNVDVVEINTYIGEVEGEDENEDDERVIIVDGEEFETEDFAEDDIVLYTMADGKIKSVKLAEVVEGVKVEKLNLSKNKFEADGETYELGAMAECELPEYDSTIDLYVDEYGFVMDFEVVETESDYAVLFGLRGADWALLDSSDEVTVRLVMLDATKQDVTATLSDELIEMGEEALGLLVEFTYDEDEDVYELELAETESLTSAEITKGKSAIIDEDNKIYTNSKTIFLIAEEDEGKWSYESVTGFKNVASMKGVAGYVVMDGVAEIVYITESEAAAAKSSDLIFVIGESGVKKQAKDTYYEYNAIVNGEASSVMIEASTEGFDFEAMVSVVTDTAENSRGVITEASFDAEILEDIEIAMGEVTKKYNDDTEILTIKRTEDSKAVGFGVAEDAVFFVVDKDGNIDADVDADDMKKGETVIFVVNEDGVIDLCFLMAEELL